MANQSGQYGHSIPSAPPRGFLGYRRRRRASSLKRLAFESAVEAINAVSYDVQACGPGLTSFPMTGPALVIANHTTYVDSVWLQRVLPREVSAMMVDRYADMPAIRYFMHDIMRVIRVEWSDYRRTAPELDEAVRRLDRGETVLLFPEGWVRRKAEEPLRQFAQGAYRILKERPEVPIVPCWVEGGWGTWVSFARGPFQGLPDFRWPIRIGVGNPQLLDAATLAHHRKTRFALMRMVVNVRMEQLGLPEIPFNNREKTSGD